MRKLARIIVSLVANALGLWAAATYIPGFHLAVDVSNRQDLQTLFILAAIFMAFSSIANALSTNDSKIWEANQVLQEFMQMPEHRIPFFSSASR